jgi:hypothetical protein
LDFANTRALDPRITFTRTTTATYYDGKTTAKAEENLFERSQEFENAYWAKTATTVTANTEVAPDGTTTAETLTDNNSNTSHFIQRISVVPVGLYTFSVFAKKDTLDYVLISFGTTFSVGVDLDAGTIVETNGAGATSTITNAGNGWWRISLTATTTSVASANIYTSTDGVFANRVYTGTDNSIFIWGAQLEQRSAVTAYTATTTQPITNYIPALQTAASGVARFDHRPLTGESLGLLVEEQRTNLFLRSDDFSDAAWTKTRSSITANTIVAPDGTLTGDKLVEDTTASNTHVVAQSVSYTSGTNYSFSLFAKAAERTSLSVQFPSGQFGASVTCSFNLSAGTVTVAISGTGTSATITAVGNGWYRCVAISQATSSGTANTPILLENTPNNRVYTGNGYSGLYIWGAQVEAGAFATSYIPTVAATVTRNADVASMTGTNFSSWFNEAGGTIYAEAFTVNAAASNDNGVWTISATGNRGYALGIRSSNNARFYRRDATSNIQTNVATFTNSLKAASTIVDTSGRRSVNGGSVNTDSTVLSNAPMNTLDIGWNNMSGTTSLNYLGGHIKKLAYYPAVLADAQLQALTQV